MLLLEPQPAKAGTPTLKLVAFGADTNRANRPLDRSVKKSIEAPDFV
jgi:hypothetical protein